MNYNVIQCLLEVTMKDVMTIRIGGDLKDKLDRMAKATARTKSYLIESAIRGQLSNADVTVHAEPYVGAEKQPTRS